MRLFQQIHQLFHNMKNYQFESDLAEGWTVGGKGWTMITENYTTVSPAYGKDYKSGKDAKADFLAGKDFRMETLCQGSGYCSIRDFAPGVSVQVRFKKMAGVVMVKVPQDVEATIAKADKPQVTIS